MTWLAALSLLCAAGPALLFLRNLRAFRPPPGATSATTRAAVLIPARDEEENIEATVQAALGSGAAEVIVLDDGSSDRTAELVRQIAAREPSLRLINGRPLPAGWCGKNFACAQLAAATREPVLIFVDADVRLAPGAAPRLAATLEQSGAQLTSGVPREITITFSEQLLIPLIHFLLLGFLPLKRMRRSRHPAYGVGCGQLFVAAAAAYHATGGHEAIRDRIHDGLALPEKFRAHAFRTDLFDATALATCRMYRRNGEVWRGLAKNTREGLGAPQLILPMTLFLSLGQVVPFVLAFSAGASAVQILAGTAACFALLPRLVAVRRFHQPLAGAFLHPLAIGALLSIQWFGLGRFLLGRPARWKGRAYPARPPDCVVRRADAAAPETLRLVQHLWDELGNLYPELSAAPFSPDEIAGERAGFVIAWLAGEPVGCGAWRPLSEAEPGVVEIKRMYVEPALRRRGIAHAILNQLESLAQADGYSVARLETGSRQPLAIRLYETSGYHQIEPFGRYRDDPLSICYEKRL